MRPRYDERERRVPGCHARGTDACDRRRQRVIHREGGRAGVAGCISRGDGKDVRAGLEDDVAGGPAGRPDRGSAATLAVGPTHLDHALIVGGRASEGQRVAAGAVGGIGDGRGDSHGGWDRIRRVWSCDAASKTRASALIAAGVYSGHLDEIDSFGDEADQGNANDRVGRWGRGDEGHDHERGCLAGWI